MASKKESPKNESKSKDSASSQSGSKKSKRRPADDRENAFNFFAWVADGATGVVEELRHSDFGLSEEFWSHYYTARRESLLAARAFVDSMIDKVEGSESKKADQEKRRQRRGGINIDF